MWNSSMPEGQHKKSSSNQQFIKLYGDFKYTKIKEGMESTCEWFLSNYPNIRGTQ